MTTKLVPFIILLSSTPYLQMINNFPTDHTFDFKTIDTPDNPNLTTIKCSVGEGETRESLIKKINNGENITNVCTSNITDFSSLFKRNHTFNQDISRWDVSNGIDFSYMFFATDSFNQPLNNWNVSNGTNFNFMFRDAKSFNQNLNMWYVSDAVSFADFSTGTLMPDDYNPLFNYKFNY